MGIIGFEEKKYPGTELAQPIKTRIDPFVNVKRGGLI
jgi:hypothetical protein